MISCREKHGAVSKILTISFTEEMFRRILPREHDPGLKKKQIPGIDEDEKHRKGIYNYR